jgi:hypothetical protein
MFQVFQVIHTYVANVLSKCCICFAIATNVFFCVFQTYVASVSTISNICCKVFHLDVTKLNLMLHILQWDPLPQSPTAAGLVCMRVERRGRERQAWETEPVQIDTRPHVGARRRGKRSSAGPHVKQAHVCMRAQQHGSWAGTANADVWALAPIRTSRC